MKKIFVIQYTTNQKWEKEEGVVIIESSKRQEAILEFKKQIKNRMITSIKQFKPNKSGIIFNKDVSLL